MNRYLNLIWVQCSLRNSSKRDSSANARPHPDAVLIGVGLEKFVSDPYVDEMSLGPSNSTLWIGLDLCVICILSWAKSKKSRSDICGMVLSQITLHVSVSVDLVYNVDLSDPQKSILALHNVTVFPDLFEVEPVSWDRENFRPWNPKYQWRLNSPAACCSIQ